jgi:hypothetical protein
VMFLKAVELAQVGISAAAINSEGSARGEVVHYTCE